MAAADIAWVLTATALVMLMVPALAFFYGGLVRKKNLVSTLVQCITIFAVVSLVWFFWGYSLVFGDSLGGIIGNLSLAGLNGITINTVNTTYAPAIPEILQFAFQLKFAAITPALIIGACAERIRFKSLLIFVVVWSTVIYCPVAHWVWNVDGWLNNLGRLGLCRRHSCTCHRRYVCVGSRLSCRSTQRLCLLERPTERNKPTDQLKNTCNGNGMVTEFKPTNIPYVILGAGLVVVWLVWI